MTVRRPGHYTVISTHKGGVVCHYPRGGPPLVDPGVLAEDRSGRRFHTQAMQPDNSVTHADDAISITAPLVRLDRLVQTPFRFFALRALALTVMRSVTIGNWIKQAIVRRLITRKRPGRISNRRTITFDPSFEIHDEWIGDASHLERIELEAPFRAIHMASQGYWQRSDDAR